VGVFDRAVKLDSPCIFSILKKFHFFLFSEYLHIVCIILQFFLINDLDFKASLGLQFCNSASNEIFGILQEFVT
jgi:hypothetical protein